MAVNCCLFALNILFSPRHHSSASNLYSSFCSNWSASKNAFSHPIFPIYSTSAISAAQHRLRTHVFNSVRSFLRVLGRPSLDVCDQLFSFSTCQLPSSFSSIGPITRDRSHHDDTLSVYKCPFQPHNANVQSILYKNIDSHCSFSPPIMLPPSFLSSYIDRPHPIPIVASRVSLPSSLRFVSMCDVLPSAVFSSYSSSVLLRTDIHMERLIRPHVYASRNEYVELVKRMRGLGMLGCTMQPRCVNGVFGVRKDENNIRLIIDARNANRYFIEPPHVLLPDPSFLTRLVLPPHVHLFVSKCDLSNFYHHIALPDWMHPFFALPPLTMSEWNGVEDVCG